MTDTPPTTDQTRPRLDIRKYPNRRYYDATRSTHITLEQLHELVLAGHDVSVTDTKSGQDITGKVLAQIILEHDPAKLDVFPSELLHKIIRSNEAVVADFVNKYFNQALSAFLHSQKQFDDYLRHAVGLNPSLAAGPQLAQTFFNPFATKLFQQGLAPTGPGADETAELRRVVDALRREVAELKAAPGRNTPAPGRNASGGGKSGVADEGAAGDASG